MLTITIPEGELFRDATQEFVTVPAQTIQMEHSLISISKWESMYHEPFLTIKQKTKAQTLDYFRCMCITSGVNPLVWSNITPEITKTIVAYMNDPMTATTIKRPEKGGPKRSQVLTSELIYSYMAEFGIPFTCEKWHINRLLTLIRVCDAKQETPKKMSPKETMAQHRAINAARRGRR